MDALEPVHGGKPPWGGLGFAGLSRGRTYGGRRRHGCRHTASPAARTEERVGALVGTAIGPLARHPAASDPGAAGPGKGECRRGIAGCIDLREAETTWGMTFRMDVQF